MEVSVVWVAGFIMTSLATIASLIMVALALRKSAVATGREDGKIEQKLDSVLAILNTVQHDMDGIKTYNLENRERIVKVETNVEHTKRSVDTLFDRVRYVEVMIPNHKEAVNG